MEKAQLNWYRKIVLDKVSKLVEDKVESGKFGATAYDKESEEDMGYYLFRWTSEPYVWEESMRVDSNNTNILPKVQTGG